MSLRRVLRVSAPRRAFFTFSHNTPATPASGLAKVVASISNAKNVQTVHKSYRALVAEFRKEKSTESPLTEDQFTNLLCLLARSARPQDILRMHAIIQDLHDTFKITLDEAHHTGIIAAFARGGHSEALCDWLSKMASLPATSPPTMNQYYIALDLLADSGASFPSLQNIVKSLQLNGHTPDQTVFEILLSARWTLAASEQQLPNVAVFIALIRAMRHAKVPYHKDIAWLMTQGYGQAGDHASVKLLVETYAQECSFQDEAERVVHHLETHIADLVAKEGINAGLEAFRSSDETKPTEHIIVALLRWSKSVEDIETVRNALDVDVPRAAWHQVLENAVIAFDMATAAAIYKAAKSSGIPTTPSFVSRYVSRLCRPLYDKKPTREAIDTAFRLYRDAKEENNGYIDVPIHRSLMRGFATINSSPAQLADMVQEVAQSYPQDRPIDPDYTASLTIWQMRTSDDFEAAYEVYEMYRQHLDAKGYLSVLAAFSALSSRDMAPLELYMSMVKHFQEAGYSVTLIAYTTYLKQISLMAPHIRTSAARLRLEQTTRQMYDFMKLDPHATPDPIFYNQLMDTYQRLGSFEQCVAVWNTIHTSGKFNNASVSIFFDACGYAGDYKQMMLWAFRLHKQGFSFNERNWHSFTEALCRTGMHDAATDFVCQTMGQEDITDLPTPAIARLLLFFSPSTVDALQIMDRLAERHPFLLHDKVLLDIPTSRFPEEVLAQLEKKRQSLIAAGDSNTNSSTKSSSRISKG
ncbi:hypothetical protein DL96DRAFT_60931 [Flagelloscypha sp. PMI_526]|nr:hypothetical protein DL96DRAFT_60931 [Flagelloscypha sp. PMI_526]